MFEELEGDGPARLPAPTQIKLQLSRGADVKHSVFLSPWAGLQCEKLLADLCWIVLVPFLQVQPTPLNDSGFTSSTAYTSEVCRKMGCL